VNHLNIPTKCLLTWAFATALLFTASGGNLANQVHKTRVPVLLELFTSEGCSSCPPADKLLGELDRGQPVEQADLIVLSEHVDYWNHLGWTDPYASPAFTERQRNYAARANSDEIYTPQLVIDGATAVVGSDWDKIQAAIRKSVREAKLPINVTAETSESQADVSIQVPSSTAKQHGALYVVLAHDHARSQVARGENAGRDLAHVAVAYSIQKVAAINTGSAFQKRLRISLPPNAKSGETRLIAFIQRSGTTQIIGAAQTRL
jgi:hypothetical protein